MLSNQVAIVVHLAGPAVSISHGFGIQRCAVCGEKLMDTRGCVVAHAKGEPPPYIPAWTIGAFVECQGPRHSVIGHIEDVMDDAGLVEEWPDNFCSELVER